MKIMIAIALLLVIAGCKHETPTMMMRCYDCDTPEISKLEVNPELKPAEKLFEPWPNSSQKYHALG